MIHVIDSICGSRKTGTMFKAIKASPEERYLYITPFLSEIEDRIPKEMKGMGFHSPNNLGKGKLSDFKRLAERGVNIASTHVLFGMFTPEIVDLLIEKEYILVIDEAVNCVGLIPTEFKPSDCRALLAGDFVLIDEGNRGKLSWNEERYPLHDGKYSTIRNLCNMEMLYSHKGIFLFWEYSPTLLRGLQEVYVLTYLFGGSGMKGWLEINKIPYEMIDPEEWGLRSEKEIKDVIRKNLTIGENRTLTNAKQQRGTLSDSWFQKCSLDSSNKYRSIMRSYVVTHGIRGDVLFWTTFKAHAKKLAAAGYSKGINGNPEDKCFLPMNLRAVNNYAHKTHCIYSLNRFVNPIEAQYIRANGGSVDEDMFALGELIQFMFRGCIRNGEPMNILLLSHRMRKLLEDWLEE